MSASERVVQSILYEVGCILIGCLVMLFVPHDGQPFVLMVIFSLLAMVWNFVFNWIFDKLDNSFKKGNLYYEKVFC